MTLPSRPSEVSGSGIYDPETEIWRDTAADQRVRWFFRDGEPLADASYRNDKLHGTVNWTLTGYPEETCEAARSLAEELGLPYGSPLTSRIEARYIDGELSAARIFGSVRHIEDLIVSAHWRGGVLHGTLWWNVKMQQDFTKPVLSFGETKIMLRDIKLPKPHPFIAEVEFLKGKRQSGVYFDREGQPMTPPPGVIETWGKESEKEVLDGYIAEGHFENDLVAFYSETKPIKKLDSPRRLTSWIGNLPEGQNQTATAFDGLVRSKRFPALLRCFDVSSYGFDCVENDLYGANDPRYVGLSSDGSGNMHLLCTMTGRVLGYEHEGGVFDERRSFNNLDEYAFTMARVEAVAQNRIDRSELTAVFERLDLGAGVFELSLL
jgi:hypothetical protein